MKVLVTIINRNNETEILEFDITKDELANLTRNEIERECINASLDDSFEIKGLSWAF